MYAVVSKRQRPLDLPHGNAVRYRDKQVWYLYATVRLHYA